jgi:hypothetical protein
MPRESSAALAIAPFSPIGPARLAPPTDLPDPERRGFAALVAALPANHFRPEDTALLCAYVRASLIERLAATEVAAGNIKRWRPVLADAQRALIGLSTRLKIGPRSRGANTGRAAKPQPPPSYYDQMVMERGDAGRR